MRAPGRVRGRAEKETSPAVSLSACSTIALGGMLERWSSSRFTTHAKKPRAAAEARA
jgi:hypothetical protein